MATAAEDARWSGGINVAADASRSPSGADRRLVHTVRDRLWQHEPFRASRARLEITAEGGRIKLAGRVRTQAMKYLAVQLAQEVEGVREAENTLVSDTETVQGVAEGLAGDPVVRAYVVRVRSMYGAVRLEGLVPSVEIEQQAMAVARRVPNVVSVESDLEIGA